MAVQDKTKIANWASTSQWKISYSYRDNSCRLQACCCATENQPSLCWASSAESAVSFHKEVRQADSNAVCTLRKTQEEEELRQVKEGRKEISPKRQPCTTHSRTVSRTEREAQRSVVLLFVRWATSAPLLPSLGESRLRGARPWTSYADATHRRRRRWLARLSARLQARANPGQFLGCRLAGARMPG